MIPSKTEGIIHSYFLRLGNIQMLFLSVQTQAESILISPAQGIPRVSNCRKFPTCWDLPILKSCRSTCHPEIAMQSLNPRIFRTARKSRGLCSSPKIAVTFLKLFRKAKGLQRKFPTLLSRRPKTSNVGCFAIHTSPEHLIMPSRKIKKKGDPSAEIPGLDFVEQIAHEKSRDRASDWSYRIRW